MKRFKLYGFISDSLVLVTNSQEPAVSSTFDEHVSFNQHQQINFSCKIMKYLGHDKTPNKLAELFYPEAMLRLETYDYNGKLETLNDLIIKNCAPTFYENNEVIQVEAVDYASERFSKRGANLNFESTGDIRQLCMQLFAESGVNTRYHDSTKNYFTEYNITHTEGTTWTKEGFLIDGNHSKFILDMSGQLNKMYYNLNFYPMMMNTAFSGLELHIKGTKDREGKQVLCEVVHKVDWNTLNSVTLRADADGSIAKIQFIHAEFIMQNPVDTAYAQENKDYTGTRESQLHLTNNPKLPLKPEIKCILKEFSLTQLIIIEKGQWHLDPLFVPNDFITFVDDTDRVYTRATLIIDGSNFYNSLIELCNLFNAEIIFDYTKKEITFINAEKTDYHGVRLSPNTNIKTFSRNETSSELYTIIDVYGGEVEDKTITLIPQMPLPFKQYFWNCIENNFNDEDYFAVFDEKHNYKTILENYIKPKMKDDEYFIQQQELTQYANILNSVPNFENRIYDITYFYNIGKVTKNNYELFNDIINNDLRKINIKITLYSEQYYILKSTLVSLKNEINFLSQNIVTEQKWKNDLNTNLDKYLLENNNVDNNLTWKTRETIATSLKTLEKYNTQLDTIFGINDELTHLNKEHYLYVLLQLNGYISAIANGFIVEKKILLDEISNEENRLDTILARSREIAKELKNTESEFQLRNLEVEQAGLIRNITNIHSKIGKKISYEQFKEYAKETSWVAWFKEVLGNNYYTSLLDHNLITCGDKEEPIKIQKIIASIGLDGIVKEQTFKLKNVHDSHDGYLRLQLTKLETIEKKYNAAATPVVGYSDYFENYYHENNLIRAKDNILERLFRLFGTYLIEGYYENTDELNSIDLAEQAKIIKENMIYPKITYDIGVIDLSSFEDYQFLHIMVGHKIKIENKEMFLEYNKKLDEYLTIAGIEYDLRNPANTKLIINKEDEDSRLIQKLFLGLLK